MLHSIGPEASIPPAGDKLDSAPRWIVRAESFLAHLLAALPMAPVVPLQAQNDEEES